MAGGMASAAGRRLGLLTGFGLLVLAVTLASCGSETSDEAAAAEPLPVAVVEIRLQDSYESRRLFAGRINPAQVADLGFQIGGEVTEVATDVGDKVEAGAVLARVDPVRAELRRSEAEAQLAEARAVLKRAEAAKGRIDGLKADGFATAQEVDDAAAERDAGRERVRLLRKALARISEDASDTALRAPFSGYVVGRYVDVGTTVTAGQPIVRLNQEAALEAQVGVPAALAGRVAIGQPFDLLSAERSALGTVVGISEEVDPRTRSRTVRLRIGDDPGLVPGSLVRLALTERRQGRGAWVPMAGLQEGYRGLWSVYVVDDQDGAGVIRRKDVEIVSLAEDAAFVRGTLEDGDRVVATSPFRFVPGQKVRIISRRGPAVPVTAAAAGGD